MTVDTTPDDPLASAIVALLAEQAQVDGGTLRPDVRAEELGLSQLEIELALFEIEDRFDIDLPLPPAGPAVWTVGELVQQVQLCCQAQWRRRQGDGG